MNTIIMINARNANRTVGLPNSCRAFRKQEGNASMPLIAELINVNLSNVK